jgi:AcrR family transcriptional regulator
MPRAGLNPEIVIDAAAAIADEEGLEAVTLAAIADRLGVKPPSLYKHVDGLDAILRGVALRGLREANARIVHAIIGLAREDALVALARAYWRFSIEHRGLYAATLRAPRPGETEIEAAGGILVGVIGSVLKGFGLSGEDALHAVRGMRAIVHGFVSLEAAGGFGLALNVEESFLRLVRGFAAGLASTGPKARRHALRIAPAGAA